VFRIRRIFDTLLAANRSALAQVETILREQFPALAPAKQREIPQLLANPLKQRFKAILYVAEDHRGRVKGFALLSHEPELRFGYLDYISAASGTTGRGIGGALYERVREEGRELGELAIFFECLPDDPALCRDAAVLKQNRARLKFYEQYGAYPLAGTRYETPLQPDDDNPPYLVCDPLGQSRLPSLAEARHIVRAILERKYGDLCPQDYIEMVVASLQDDPVRLRAPRYLRKELPAEPPATGNGKIALVVNDRHEIHHVRERGYVEAPVRIASIRREIERTGLFHEFSPRPFPERHLRAVHAADYLAYFKRMCTTLPADQALYPYVFPVRNAARPPRQLVRRAGYFCIDTFTPLHVNAYPAARRAVDCTLTAADRVLERGGLAYALVRPPGHHAERRFFGGFCYFNNAAIAAEYLASYGRVAILDLDYHHGNGQQQIFYRREDVLTLSIHAHPNVAYPYFSGFADEKGRDAGTGFNFNLPLPEEVDANDYFRAVARALQRVRRFRPEFLVVCLGFDTGKGDPTGTWNLGAKDFERLGQTLGGVRLPTLVVQEGGYRTRSLGVHARHFFSGLWKGFYLEKGGTSA